MTPLIAYLLLAVFAACVFGISSLWWLSGWQGASADEPGPIGATIFLTLVGAAFMYGLGWIP